MPQVSLRLRLRSHGVLIAFAALVLSIVSTMTSTAAVHGTEPVDPVALHRPAAAKPVAVASAPAANMLSEDAWADTDLGGLDSRVLALALGAARCATSRGAVVEPQTLTIIDYSKASTEPRLWVLDLERPALLYEELVAHGQGSGSNFATSFSNQPDSHQTSLGLFRTRSTYVGRNGYSLRLDGLDRGFNDRAQERAIVMHGAPYVNGTISKSLGRLGRSHGCPAVRASIARELIDRVKDGNLVFAYYPDARWLKTSTFLNGCAQNS
jgi:hypothetical protein